MSGFRFENVDEALKYVLELEQRVFDECLR